MLLKATASRWRKKDGFGRKSGIKGGSRELFHYGNASNILGEMSEKFILNLEMSCRISAIWMAYKFKKYFEEIFN